MKNFNQAQDPSTLVLSEYEEVTGKIVSLRQKDHYLIVTLSSGTLVYSLDTREAKICEKELTGKEGKRISILRVPDKDEPLMVYFAEHRN